MAEAVDSTERKQQIWPDRVRAMHAVHAWMGWHVFGANLGSLA